MRKIIFPIAIVSILMTNCVDEPDTYNNDQSKAYSVPAGTLLTDAQKELSDQLTSPNINLNVFRFYSQYLTETQYTDESKYNLTKRSIANNFWDNLYRDVLGNLESAKSAVLEEVKSAAISQSDWDIKQKNKLAIIELQEVYTFQILVDTFGDIPYSEALNPNIVLPKYDDDATIYPKLIDRLNNALLALDTNGSSFDNGDYIFNGDVSKWKLFGNSLKVKLGINIADSNNSLAKTTIESAANIGVIDTNSKNATFNYAVSAPNYNPIYDNLVASGRNDFVPTSTIIDDMNTLNDPRRAVYFTQIGGIYKGGKYGFSNSYSSFSHVGDYLKTPNLPGVLFEASEMNFYLAEAAERGFTVPKTATEYYNIAIQSSFEFWGISSLADAYLLDPNVAYATATGESYKEKIAHQAWIALYNRGFESWNTWRRLDSPLLIAPTTAVLASGGLIPKRFTYPVKEQTVNGTNYQAASIAIGGDKLYSRVFWDVN